MDNRKIIIKTNIPIKINAQYEKVMSELYHLEDLNRYKNNTIKKCVDEMQKIQFKEGV